MLMADVPSHRTNLTDAEWDLVAGLFERAPGQRGTQLHYNRRELVNACPMSCVRLHLAAGFDLGQEAPISR
jgi:transposase